MSTELTPIVATKTSDEITVTRFSAKPNKKLQLTQGLGLGLHDPGFIQVDRDQAAQLIVTLDRFVADVDKAMEYLR